MRYTRKLTTVLKGNITQFSFHHKRDKT